MDDWHNWRQCLSWVKIDESYLYDANQTLTWFSPPRPMMSDPLISSMAATRVRGGRPNWNPQCTWHAQKPTVQETCAVTHRALSMRKPKFDRAPMLQTKNNWNIPYIVSSVVKLMIFFIDFCFDGILCNIEKIRNIREHCIHLNRFSSVCCQKYKESVRSAYLLQLHSIPYYHPLIPVAPPCTILPGAPPMLRRWQPHNKPSVAHDFLKCCKICRNWWYRLWSASHMIGEQGKGHITFVKDTFL